MIKGPILLNRVYNGTGYTIEEINTHEHFSIYEFAIYRNNQIVKKETRISIIDAIRSAAKELEE